MVFAFPIYCSSTTLFFNISEWNVFAISFGSHKAVHRTNMFVCVFYGCLGYFMTSIFVDPQNSSISDCILNCQQSTYGSTFVFLWKCRLETFCLGTGSWKKTIFNKRNSQITVVCKPVCIILTTKIPRSFKKIFVQRMKKIANSSTQSLSLGVVSIFLKDKKTFFQQTFHWKNLHQALFCNISLSPPSFSTTEQLKELTR